MCQNIRKARKSLTEFTGYKKVIKFEDRYYSPVTGVEYKVGEKVQAVEIPKVIRKYDHLRGRFRNYVSDMAISDVAFINKNPKMHGLTSVFVERESLMKFTIPDHRRDDTNVKTELTNVRMTITGTPMYTGRVSALKLVLGDTITAIEEL